MHSGGCKLSILRCCYVSYLSIYQKRITHKLTIRLPEWDNERMLCHIFQQGHCFDLHQTHTKLEEIFPWDFHTNSMENSPSSFRISDYVCAAIALMLAILSLKLMIHWCVLCWIHWDKMLQKLQPIGRTAEVQADLALNVCGINFRFLYFRMLHSTGNFICHVSINSLFNMEALTRIENLNKIFVEHFERMRLFSVAIFRTKVILFHTKMSSFYSNLTGVIALDTVRLSLFKSEWKIYRCFVSIRRSIGQIASDSMILEVNVFLANLGHGPQFMDAMNDPLTNSIMQW